MLNFYDFEVFKHDWLVVIINPIEKTEKVIVNNKEELEQYYNEHKEEIWIGYNNRNYDQYILKAILCEFNPYDINNYIIVEKKSGYNYSSLFKKFPLNNFDVGTVLYSLKQLEGFMGNDIRETTVPFDIDRKLTEKEIQETIFYCRHDVEQTIDVFLERKNEFDAQMSLIKTFKLPINYIGKTQAQLASIILNARQRSYDDEWDIRLPETLNLNKYKFVADWFLNKENHKTTAKLKCDIAGVEHIVAWGGLHGAINKYSYTCKDDEILVMADVDQLYPTLMVKYHLLSRAVTDYEKFEYILSESLRLKKLKKKKEREPYKRICNITYGAEGDKYNSMYDPLHRNLVCVFGQLLLLDLIEKIEPFSELIQSNTDGILIKIKENNFDLLDDTVYEWEKRTGLHMSFDCYKTIIQKDVNNYILIDYERNTKSKGAYVKELSSLDYDLPIINKCLVDYMTKGISVCETVSNCHQLQMFQKIVRVSGKYLCAWHNGFRLSDKTFRVFASKNEKDGYIGKQKKEGATIEKFANTPEHCFIDNTDVKNKEVPYYLDKNWYIELANKRLKDFGIEVD